MGYRLVAFDLDGTLLKDDQSLSPENNAAIGEMTRRGVSVAISTGRTYGEILPALRAHPDIRYVIHSDGAVIFDKHTGQRQTCCFAGDLQKLVLDTLFACKTWFTVRYRGVSYYDGARDDAQSYAFHRVTPYYQELVHSSDVPKADFAAFCYAMEEIEQITVFFHSDEELAYAEKTFLDTGLLETSCSSVNSFEVYHASAGKGKGLWRLADQLGIDRGDTVAVGDTINDLTIIRAAGLGLAVSNAMPGLKEVADAVICSNEEHAAKFVLEHYL